MAACTGGGGSGGAPSTDAPDPSAPGIGGLQIEPDGYGNATVTLRTDRAASVCLEAGPGDDTTHRLDGEPMKTEHEFHLSGLSLDTFYQLRIKRAGAPGNEEALVSKTFFSGSPANGGVLVAGVPIVWQPVEISFRGPFAGELDTSPNPFLDYRLVVQFTSPAGDPVFVHGFFDGDGKGGGTGDVWRVRFAPSMPGTWKYRAHFHSGNNVAISLSGNDGTPVSFHGTHGAFAVVPRDQNAEGFYKWGCLDYVGEHYLKFRNGPYFIKGGTDSPENFLAYRGFDNTIDQGGIPTDGLNNGLHDYPTHVADWGTGGLGTADDPYFVSQTSGYDSRAIIGALNYLASMNVNSIYFLPMNLGGDGQETCPFTGYANTNFAKTHYDISKLRQWNQVFEHAQRRGILLHFVLAETEHPNETWLDNGFLGTQRKLFYREMVARFGHHLAIKWNLSEESDYGTNQVIAFADYIQKVDPYDHPIAFHSHPLPSNGDNPDWTAVLGDPRFSMNSIQANPDFAGRTVERWREDSAAAGRPWVVEFDESLIGLDDRNAHNLRRRKLYDVLFSGGSVEWYAGYHPLPLGGDLRMEDFRQREDMWRYTWIARQFLQMNVPFERMEPADQLLSGETSAWGGGEVFALHDRFYAIYLPDVTDTGTLDLRGTTGTFERVWYDPETGQFVGNVVQVQGGDYRPVGVQPTGGPLKDWVVLFRK